MPPSSAATTANAKNAAANRAIRKLAAAAQLNQPNKNVKTVFIQNSIGNIFTRKVKQI